MDRILWEGREKNIVDEIVVTDCSVHIEMMDGGCWFISIYKDGKRWDGNFSVTEEVREAPGFYKASEAAGYHLEDEDPILARLWQQENEIEWDSDKSHDPTEETRRKQ